MISDVLSDFVGSIDLYLDDPGSLPRYTDEVYRRAQAIRDDADRLRCGLDTVSMSRLLDHLLEGGEE